MKVRLAISLLVLQATLLSGQLLLSHNDYEQDIPLHDAISKGFDIIEADVFLRDGAIVVCHDENDINNAPFLLNQYILPLRQYSSEDIKNLTLMLDVKKYSQDLMEKITSLKTEHQDLFDHVTILISGEIDRTGISNNPLFDNLKIDGRLHLADSKISKTQMPIISIKVTDVCDWKGSDRITRDQALKLKSVIDQVHSSGRMIRFWNVKDDHQAWNVLRALGVDIIGVDNLDRMNKSLLH